MNRLQHLAEVEQALAPVRDLLTKTRLGITTQFNPLMTQIALGYAHVHAIAALAADEPGDDPLWVDEAAAIVGDLPTFDVPIEQPTPQGDGLIIPR